MIQTSLNPLQLKPKTMEVTMMGTTIMALRYSGGVMMVADSVSSRGYFVSSRFSKKGNQISPDVEKHGNIIAMRCGVAPHTQYVTKMISNYLSYHAMELQDRKIGKLFGIFGGERRFNVESILQALFCKELGSWDLKAGSTSS